MIDCVNEWFALCACLLACFLVCACLLVDCLFCCLFLLFLLINEFLFAFCGCRRTCDTLATQLQRNCACDALATHLQHPCNELKLAQKAIDDRDQSPFWTHLLPPSDESLKARAQIEPTESCKRFAYSSRLRELTLALELAFATRMPHACDALETRLRLRRACDTLATHVQHTCIALATQVQRTCNALAFWTGCLIVALAWLNTEIDWLIRLLVCWGVKVVYY